jgi:hypothetical protein
MAQLPQINNVVHTNNRGQTRRVGRLIVCTFQGCTFQATQFRQFSNHYMTHVCTTCQNLYKYPNLPHNCIPFQAMPQPGPMNGQQIGFGILPPNFNTRAFVKILEMHNGTAVVFKKKFNMPFGLVADAIGSVFQDAQLLIMDLITLYLGLWARLVLNVTLEHSETKRQKNIDFNSPFDRYMSPSNPLVEANLMIALNYLISSISLWGSEGSRQVLAL